ncbi:hypothetical protein BO85DRAFT_450060 [Aspergillus piperis CBS 112811]|uniref:Uncharacterized protein n=1 Tax=Aspergillus piperis CBS 112811 TaxID=1448313 RepID=A0A8G1R183_9EURO|nr:hypothetical protein BO85DRAFT_450060 [Aspergillus piperis CBS 112811]RAH56652.1 hypothetical protein BO85DRAFT_450060 [Aspergillus piperis CBS 112811]
MTRKCYHEQKSHLSPPPRSPDNPGSGNPFAPAPSAYNSHGTLHTLPTTLYL